MGFGKEEALLESRGRVGFGTFFLPSELLQKGSTCITNMKMGGPSPGPHWLPLQGTLGGLSSRGGDSLIPRCIYAWGTLEEGENHLPLGRAPCHQVFLLLGYAHTLSLPFGQYQVPRGLLGK